MTTISTGAIPGQGTAFSLSSQKTANQSLFRTRSLPAWTAGALVCLLLCFGFPSYLRAQATSGTISGTIEDQSGDVVPGAQVSLIDQATQTSRVTASNATGYYTFPDAQPSTYTVKATAKGFEAKQVTGIVLHAGASLMVPPLKMNVGQTTQTVTVQATAAMIPVDNGAREAVITSHDLKNLALEGQDTTELLKVLPGATTMVASATNNSPQFSDLNISANESAIGTGINLDGAPNRGGTELLSDGVDVLDPGDEGGSISTIFPFMTHEVSVQTTSFGAENQYGPVIVSAITKSGGANYHGEAFFDARNDILNANGWFQNHQHLPLAGASYYYPGGDIGGPIPHTHKKLFFWGGVEFFRQNQGNANILQSYVPSPAMMAGDFTSDNPANNILCPSGFSSTVQGQWCNNLSGTVMPNGAAPTPAAAGQTGAVIPPGEIDPASKALSSFWPAVWNPDGTPNPAGGYSNPATTPSGYDYTRTVINTNNGWVWSARVDWAPNANNHVYISYQQGYSGELAQGNGAHIYWTPGNAVPFPGGGIYGKVYTKALSGHLLHTFGPTATNDFIAAWGYGNFPFTVPNLSAAYKSTLGYPTTYGQPYNSGSLLIPSYSSAGTNTFPDFSQSDIFENPLGQYEVRKEVPSFYDTFTKVWGRHTLKIGGFTQNTGNIQSNDGTSINGSIGSFGGQNPDLVTGGLVGSPQNPDANFDMGVVSSYNQQNAAPISDMAYQVLAGYAQDNWRVNNRLNVEFGARFEHDGHWYDRKGVGMADFFPSRVLSDFYAGKPDPGYYWHGIDPGIPNAGQPTRLMFVSPRFGMSWDLFGNGKTVVRGGWGAYRFTGQYNDYAAALTTAQQVQSYNLPGGKNITLSQLGSIKVPTPVPPSCPPITAPGATIPTCTNATVNGSQNGLDANDYGEPLTYDYNLTIDQRLPWNSLLDLAYIGNSTQELLDVSESIQGSDFTAFGDQNKTPLGALFRPDPVTGITAQNPENVTQQLDGTKIPNTYADYHPFGYAYGTNTVEQAESIGYANYNAFQATWLKQAGRLTYDFNFTWSKSLGSALQENPFVWRLNYGPEPIDRPYVFNASYTYTTGALHTGSALLNGAAGGWTLSGITTWQAGGYLPDLEPGNDVPNFGMSLAYDPATLPANAKAIGLNTNIGDPTYYGTDATIEGADMIMPKLTCNPATNLAATDGSGSFGQRVKLKCFSAPPVGTYGGQNYPYMSMSPYLENDLALYKTFNIHKRQNIQLRFSAFHLFNHPLPDFSSGNQLTLRYLVNYATKAITLNTGSGGTVPSWGYQDSKNAYPGGSRVLEMDATYNF